MHGGTLKIKAGDRNLLEANLEKIDQCVVNAIDQMGGDDDTQDGEEKNDEDFEFNQDFEIKEGTRSPGWIRYLKRIK